MQDDQVQALINENEKLQILFDSVPAWVFYKDDQNRFVKVNKAFCEAQHKTKEQIEGKSAFDMFPDEQAKAYWEDDKEVMASGVPKLGIVERADSAAGSRWVQTDKIPYRDGQGAIIGIIGFAIDITERKSAEESEEKSQSVLQNIIDLLPVRIFWKDMDLSYLGCNQVFAQDAGKKSPDEVIGKDDTQMGWKDQASLYQADDKKVIKSGAPKLDYEEPQTTPTGDTIWLNTNKLPLVNSKGQTYGILGTYMDITERKNAEEKLKSQTAELQKMNDMMTGRELKMVELKEEIRNLKKRLGED